MFVEFLFPLRRVPASKVMCLLAFVGRMFSSLDDTTRCFSMTTEISATQLQWFLYLHLFGERTRACVRLRFCPFFYVMEVALFISKNKCHTGCQPCRWLPEGPSQRVVKVICVVLSCRMPVTTGQTSAGVWSHSAVVPVLSGACMALCLDARRNIPLNQFFFSFFFFYIVLLTSLNEFWAT